MFPESNKSRDSVCIEVDGRDAAEIAKVLSDRFLSATMIEVQVASQEEAERIACELSRELGWNAAATSTTLS